MSLNNNTLIGVIIAIILPYTLLFGAIYLTLVIIREVLKTVFIARYQSSDTIINGENEQNIDDWSDYHTWDNDYEDNSYKR